MPGREDAPTAGTATLPRRNYLVYWRKLAADCGRSPRELGETEIRRFLLHPI